MKTEQLIMFAKISQITYDDPKESQKKFKDIGFDIVEFFDVGGAQAYFLKSTRLNVWSGCVLSFRGTSEKSDIKSDLTSGKNFEINNNGFAVGKIHVGFKHEINKLWEKISKSLHDVSNVYITGHSLGAAMATIAASRLQTKALSLITFGSPRVGDKTFVDNLKVPHYRVQNNCDDVTKVPLYLMGFRHHGTHMYMNYYGQFRSLTTWQRVKDMIRSRVIAWKKGEHFLGAKDHFMANYILALEKPKDEA